MISWIVASHREDVLRANLLATLRLYDGDELIVERDAASITRAYAAGQAKATQPVRVYVHHDVRVLDLAALRLGLILRTDQVTLGTGAPVGMVGLIGSRDAVMPWWDGDTLGSVVDARMGVIGAGRQGGACAMLDGLLLATRQTVEWDVEAPGWHGYDHDACAQQLAAGRTNWALSNGHTLVEHNTGGPTDVNRLAGWNEAVARFAERWGVPA